LTDILVYIVNPEHRAHLYMPPLKEHFPDLDIRLVESREEAAKAIPEAEVLLTYGGLVSDEMAKSAKKLRWLHSLVTGTDWIYRIPSLGKDVIVTATRGIHGPPMSEMTVLLMLALARDFSMFLHNQDKAIWKRHPGGLLQHKTVGIFGVGSITEYLAPLLKAFDMTVIGISQTARPVPGIDRFVTRDRLLEVAPELDFLVALMPYSPETHHIINRELLSAMKPTAFFVNIARGGVVDDEALIEALNTGKIAGAALDAVTPEPLPPDHPYWKMKNVLVTPHVAGICDTYVDYVLPIFEDNLRAYLAGETDKLVTRVDH